MKLWMTAAAGIFACGLGLPIAMPSTPASPAARRLVGTQRVGPPSALRCSRDHLTAFIGRVLLYRRETDHIFLRVRTDEETTENFTLRLGKGEDGSRYYLLRGAEFKAEDWKHIEQQPGRLKPGMRAIVWVCDDGSTPVVDWRPAEE